MTHANPAFDPHGPADARPTLLFLCDDPDVLGGVQRVLATLVHAFARRGYRVVVTSLLASEGHGFLDPVVERVALFREGAVSRLLQRPRVGPLHLRGRRLLRLRWLAQRRARAALRAQVAALQPRAVIVFDSLMAKIAAESRLSGARVLVQYHNSYASVAGTPDLERLRRASLAVSGFLGLTAEDAAGFAAAGFARIGYVANPVSFYPNALPATRTRRVVALGRYHHQKAFDHLVAAWARVERRDGWHLDIYGEGPERGLIEAAICNTGVADSVTLHGPTHDAEAVLLNAAIYALSSRFEGFGMVLAEAMACGIPVAATRCGPGPEALADGCGLLSEIGDIDAMAVNLQRLIDDPALRTALGAGGRSKVLAHAPETIVKRWEAVIAASTPIA